MNFVGWTYIVVPVVSFFAGSVGGVLEHLFGRSGMKPIAVFWSLVLMVVLVSGGLVGCGGRTVTVTTSSAPPSDSARARAIADYLYTWSTTFGPEEWLTPVASRTNGPETYPSEADFYYEGVAQPGHITVTVQLDTAVVAASNAMNGDDSLYQYAPNRLDMCQAVLAGHFANINHVRVSDTITVRAECP